MDIGVSQVLIVTFQVLTLFIRIKFAMQWYETLNKLFRTVQTLVPNVLCTCDTGDESLVQHRNLALFPNNGEHSLDVGLRHDLAKKGTSAVPTEIHPHSFNQLRFYLARDNLWISLHSDKWAIFYFAIHISLAFIVLTTAAITIPSFHKTTVRNNFCTY